MRKIHLFAFLCVLTSTSAFAINGDMGIGTDPNTDGSETYPYLIEDVNDFDTFADPANAATYWAAGVHTKLMTNIDLSGRTYTTAVIAPDTPDTSWNFEGIPFTGIFDGNNKIINSLTINHTENSWIGLFGYIDTGGEVYNLSIADANIIGYDYVACLAGLILNSSIDNCNASGKLEIKGYQAGGLIARTDTSSISNCKSNVKIHCIGHSVGGLIGDNYDSSITNCHSFSIVSGDDDNLGGLIGHNDSGIIVNSSSTSNVFATGLYCDYIGGLIGYSGYGLISSCWSNSQTTGRYYVGGLVGYNSSLNTIQNSYSTGQVSGNSSVGGLVGKTGFGICTLTTSYSNCRGNGSSYVGGVVGLIDDNDTVTSCFWDVDTSGIGNSGDDNFGATGKTTAEMMTQSTFTGWDFNPDDGDPADWKMLRQGEDYPRLAWQEVFDGDIAGLYGVDMVDFAYLANYWGQDCDSPECDRADVNTSGTIDLPDLAAVAANWLSK